MPPIMRMSAVIAAGMGLPAGMVLAMLGCVVYIVYLEQEKSTRSMY